MALRPLQGPLARGQWLILVGVVRTLNHITTAGHVVVAVVRTVQLIRPIPAVIFTVTTERCIHTPPI